MITKEQMLDITAKRYGLESRWTIWMYELSKKLTRNQLYQAYILLNSNIPYFYEEDDKEWK